MAPVKVFVTSITANPEIRARVRRTRALLEALGIDFDAIDITEAGNEEQRIFMRENAIKEGVKGPPLAPQFFFNNEYLGDYSDFDEAVENNQIAEFLRLTPNSKNATQINQINKENYDEDAPAIHNEQQKEY